MPVSIKSIQYILSSSGLSFKYANLGPDQGQYYNINISCSNRSTSAKCTLNFIFVYLNLYLINNFRLSSIPYPRMGYGADRYNSTFLVFYSIWLIVSDSFKLLRPWAPRVILLSNYSRVIKGYSNCILYPKIWLKTVCHE